MRVSFKKLYAEKCRFYCTTCGNQLHWNLIHIYDNDTLVYCKCGEIYSVSVRVEATGV